MKIKRLLASEPKTPYILQNEGVQFFIRLALIGLAYFGAARLGLLFVLQPEGLAGIWPASGVALAAILISLQSRRPRIQYGATLAVIFMVNVLANLSSGNSLTISMGFAIANTIEPAIGAFIFLLIYNSGENRSGETAGPIVIHKMRHVIALVAATLSTLGSAFIGAWVPTLGFGASYWDVWKVWWVEDGLGILVFTPIVLVIQNSVRLSHTHSTRWWIELIILILGTGLVSWVSFGVDDANNLLGIRPYMGFVIIFWAAMRFSIGVMSFELVLLAGIALGATAFGVGSFPLGGDLPGVRLVLVQLYLFVASLTALVLVTIFTERRRTFAELRYHSDLLDHISDAVISSDINFVIRSWNKAAEEIYGWKAEEVLGKSIHEVVKTDDTETAILAQESLTQTGFWKGEITHRGKEGRTVQVLSSVRLVTDANDGSTKVVSTLRDISEHKQTLEALQKSENRLRFALEGANDGLWDVDMRTNEVFMSPRGCEMLGYKPEEMVEVVKVWNQLVHPEDLPETNKRLTDHLLGKSPIFEIEQRLRMKSGDWKWVHTRGKLVERGTEGQPIRMTGTHTDITERRQVTEALRERNSFIETILEHAPIGFAVNRMSDGEATFIGSKFYSIYGVAQGGFHSVPEFFESVYPDPIFREKMVTRISNDIASGDVSKMRWENIPITTHDGKSIVVTSSNIPLPEQNLMISTVQDVTQQATAEEEIRKLNAELEKRIADRTEQLEAANREMRSFSYTVSHDLRAPLRALNGFSEILMENHASQLDDEGLHYLQRIKEASSRMSSMIDDLLVLTRVSGSELSNKAVNLTAMAHDIAVGLKSQAPERAVEIVIADGMEVQGDLNLLKDALENLMTNAYKYSSKVTQACIEIGKMEEEGKVVYFVRDNGDGFDMAYANKLFQPFQRLHSPAEFPGNGIGLATVKRIIERHGGRIWAEGHKGMGATFFFTLGEKGA